MAIYQQKGRSKTSSLFAFCCTSQSTRPSLWMSRMRCALICSATPSSYIFKYNSELLLIIFT